MIEWTEKDQALFNTIARMKQMNLLKSMRKYLRKHYYPEQKVFTTDSFILVEGTIPVMLVAHMDTVFKNPPDKIYYDQKQHVMWSPQGLGADDRAGVYLIWRIIQDGYKPHICLTTDEEFGGLGVGAMIRTFKTAPFDIKYIIELDRQGTNDCVFYSCANHQFQAFIETYDFVTDWGTYSDISDICPAWKIAGVNLSVGYKGEHKETEILNTKAMLSTYKKVEKMLDDAKTDAVEHFKYIPDPYEYYYYNLGKKYSELYGYNDDEEWMEYERKMNNLYDLPVHRKFQCSKCGKIYDEDDIFPVKAKSHPGEEFYCVDCVGISKINWCTACGEPFEAEKDTDNFCPDCAHQKR